MRERAGTWFQRSLAAYNGGNPEVRELGAAAVRIEVRGERYPEALERRTGL